MKIQFRGKLTEITELVNAIESVSRVVIKSYSYDGRNTIVIEFEEEVPVMQPDDFDHLFDDMDMPDYSDFDVWDHDQGE